jgi:hypothetical protein
MSKYCGGCRCRRLKPPTGCCRLFRGWDNSRPPVFSPRPARI